MSLFPQSDKYLSVPSPQPLPHLGPDRRVFVIRSIHDASKFVCVLNPDTQTAHLVVFTHSHEAHGYFTAARTGDNRRLAEWAEIVEQRIGDLPISHVLLHVEPLGKLVSRRFTNPQNFNTNKGGFPLDRN